MNFYIYYYKHSGSRTPPVGHFIPTQDYYHENRQAMRLRRLARTNQSMSRNETRNGTSPRIVRPRARSYQPPEEEGRFQEVRVSNEV